MLNDTEDWSLIRYDRGEFFVENESEPSFDLREGGSLPWPTIWLSGHRMERQTHAIWDIDGALWISRASSPPVRRLFAADTRSRTDFRIGQAAASGERDQLYIVASVDDRDGDTLPEIVLAHGGWNERLDDVLLPARAPSTVELVEDVSVLAFNGEIWIAARWSGQIDGVHRAGWMRLAAAP